MYTNLTIKDLQKILRSNGLPFIGKKQELIDRLIQNKSKIENKLPTTKNFINEEDPLAKLGKWVIYEDEMSALTEEDKKYIDQLSVENYNNNLRGDVILGHLIKNQIPKITPGYISIFLEYEQKESIYGLGAINLCPDRLGPVNHSMSLLPAAKNLTNFYQFAKVYNFDVYRDKSGKYILYDNVLKDRIADYLDPIPHQSKLDLYEKNPTDHVLFSVFYTLSGEERRFNYIEARFFFCYYYQKLVSETIEFQRLEFLLQNGFNLQLWGYNSICSDPVPRIYDCYLDPSKPFGHELILYCLFYISNEEDFPWNIYREKHKALYENFSFN